MWRLSRWLMETLDETMWTTHILGGAEEEGFTIDDLKGRATDYNEFKEQELGPEWLRECGQI